MGIKRWLKIGRYKTQDDMTPDEVIDTLVSVGEVPFAAAKLQINESALREYMKDQSIPEDVQSQFLTASASIADEVAFNMNQLFERSVPEKIEEQFLLAKKYFNKDDLVGDLIDKTVDLASNGVHLRPAGTDSKVKKLKKFERELNLHAIANQMFLEGVQTDNVVKLTKKDAQGRIQYFQILPSDRVKVRKMYRHQSGRPQKKVFLKVPKDLVLALRHKRISESDIPAHWVQGINQGAMIDGRKQKGWVELREDKGEFVKILNRSGVMDQLVPPRMARIFPLINMRKVKLEAEFSVDTHIKSMIHQVVVDKTKTAVKSYGVTIAKATQAELNKIRTAYQSAMGKAMFEATGPEIEHKFHAPEFVKFSPPEKYKVVDENIERHFGFSRVMTVGDSGSYSSGYIYAKGLIARIEQWRRIVGDDLSEDFSFHIKDEVTVGYNKAVLKEAAQHLKEAEFRAKYSLASLTTLTEEFGDDVVFERTRKEKERKEPDNWTPIFEPSQGIVAFERGAKPGSGGDGEPGAPKGDGPQSTKENQPENPDA